LLRRDDIGEISAGKQADLAIFNLDELRFSGAGDPIAALVTCGAHAVDRLMVGGEWLIESAEHRDFIARDLIQKHSQLAKKLQSS
jgi:8-oxoguanine deaminase